MTDPRTPPHLAAPELAYPQPAETDAYFTAVMRGFHAEYVAEKWEHERKVAELDRDFGFRVDGRWIATCGAFSRTMSVPGGQVPVAAVSIVTVAPAYRRRGLLTRMMKHQLEDVQRRGEPLALLWASESLIYGRFGYGSASPRLRLHGPTRSTAFSPQVDTGAGSVDEVGRDEFVAAVPALRERLLDRRPGQLNRTPDWWEVTLFDPEAWRKGSSPLRYALHFGAGGEVDGYALFRTREAESEGAEVQVLELDATEPSGYAALWRFLLDLDLIRVFSRRNAPLDEPLRQLVADQRAITTELQDATYVRLVDIPAALTARTYGADLDLILGLRDALLSGNEGAYRLRIEGGRASVTRAEAQPDVSLAVRELGASYLGGTSLAHLHRAGLVQEHRPGAVTELAAAFTASPAPFCPDFF